MIAFQVHDMTSGHCASAITKALKDLGAQTTVDIDLPRRLAMVDAPLVDPQRIADAIVGAGYTPQPVPVEVASLPAVPASCCGTCR